MLAWASLLACGEGSPPNLSPALTELPPAKNELSTLQGRWEAGALQEGGAVRCEGEATFVELRGDGEGGWELVAQVGPDLAILPILIVERNAMGLDLELAAITPGEPNQDLKLSWLEPGKLATFRTLRGELQLGDRPFVAPAHAASLPTAKCSEQAGAGQPASPGGAP